MAIQKLSGLSGWRGGVQHFSQDWCKVVVGRCWGHLEATRNQTCQQDWGKVVVGSCWCHFEATKPVGHDRGKVAAEKPNLSARIGLKWLLRGASAILKAVSQDWGKVVVGRCWLLAAIIPRG